MGLPVEPFYDESFDNACGDWADDMSEAFYIAVKDAIHPELIDSLKIDIATTLAHSYVMTGDSKILEAYGLTSAHAYCFLHDITGVYGKEVEECASEYFSNV